MACVLFTIATWVALIAPSSDAQITTVVGTTLSAPLDAVADAQDNIYIADQNNRLVKMRSASTLILSVLSAFTAQLVGSNPKGVAVDPLGSLVFVAGEYCCWFR
jgi:DNA-binding beta-propeller fold protein YncE